MMATPEEILQERLLIQQCQEGDQTAWCRLVERYERCIAYFARRFLGPERRRADLVEDNVAQVWASLGWHQGQRVRGYDPQRGRFSTFLARRTWQVVQKDRDKRQRRVVATTLDWEPPDSGVAVGTWEECLEEFLATLPAWEADFCRAYLLGAPEVESQPALSAVCIRKRVQRLRRKFEAYLDSR